MIPSTLYMFLPCPPVCQRHGDESTLSGHEVTWQSETSARLVSRWGFFLGGATRTVAVHLCSDGWTSAGKLQVIYQSC